MAREWEAECIRRWEAGETAEAIAAALGIPEGTARSRVYTLQQEGKIATRPKGGRRTPAPVRTEGTPARAPAPTREAPAITFMAVPEVRELISTVKDLSARVAALENGTRGTTRDPPAPAAHPRVNIKQWTVRLSQPLIDAVKAQATTEGKEPSHLVEELLWQALTDQRPSPP